MATMADVARMAGVSTATVSHVLNGTRPVRASTREQVLSAVAATHYTPNTVARSLATARTTTMGLVLSAISNPYFGELLQRGRVGGRRGGLHAAAGRPPRGPGLRADRRHPAAPPPRRRRGPRPERTPGRHPGLPRPPPGADGAARPAHRRRARPGGSARTRRPPPGSPATSPTTGTPGSGWWPAWTGCRPPPSAARATATRCAPAACPSTPIWRSAAPPRPIAARRATHRLLALDDRPTAIVAGNNSMTIGVMQALRDAGLVGAP